MEDVVFEISQIDGNDVAVFLSLRLHPSHTFISAHLQSLSIHSAHLCNMFARQVSRQILFQTSMIMIEIFIGNSHGRIEVITVTRVPYEVNLAIMEIR